MTGQVTVQLEPWEAIWPAVNDIATKHFNEVDGGIEPRRPFKVKASAMQAMSDAGILKIVTARSAGQLVGYFTWTITEDIESEGLMIALQGAWFVDPAARFRRVGIRLFMKSVTELRLLGVKNIFPHHRLQGSGAALGKFFKRQGAIEIQHTYSLWIGD